MLTSCGLVSIRALVVQILSVTVLREVMAPTASKGLLRQVGRGAAMYNQGRYCYLFANSHCDLLFIFFFTISDIKLYVRLI